LISFLKNTNKFLDNFYPPFPVGGGGGGGGGGISSDSPQHA
tara:strand:+ start:2641 stop:2763 length:123 start_codon:yes stop_codon:yes gene_type:complete